MNAVEVTFKVHNDIVHGLKFCTFIKKMGITVKDEENMGSFAPTEDVHRVQMSPEKVQTGFFARGSYTGKAMLIDLDAICHLQYEFKFEIAKEW
jgi:Rho GDP-dissociation inhibitor